MKLSSDGQRILDFRPLDIDPNTPYRLWGRTFKEGESYYLTTSEGRVDLQGDFQLGALTQIEIDDAGRISKLQTEILGTVQKFSNKKAEVVPLDSGDVIEAALSGEPKGGELVLALNSTKGNSAHLAALLARLELVREAENGFAEITVLGYRAEQSANTSFGSSVLDENSIQGGALRRVRVDAPQARELLDLMKAAERLGTKEKPIIQFAARELLVIEQSASLVIRTVQAENDPNKVGPFVGRWLDNGDHHFLRVFMTAGDEDSLKKDIPQRPKIYFDLYVPDGGEQSNEKPGYFSSYTVAGAIKRDNDAPADKVWTVDETQRQVFVGQSIFTWVGESLGVSPLYDALSVSPGTGKVTARPQSEIDKTRAKVKKIRFLPNYHTPDESMFPLLSGCTYYFRLRALNLAGKAPRIDEVTVQRENAEKNGALHLTYYRYDPIAAPRILRSKHLHRVEIPAENSGAEQANGADNNRREQTIHYVRTVISENTGEEGVLDGEAMFFVLPGATVYEIARAHGLLFPQLGPMMDTNEIYSYLESVERESAAAAPYDRRRGHLPYMPDPLAENVAFQLVVSPSYPTGSTVNGDIRVFSFRLRWPKAIAVRVRFRAAKLYDTRVVCARGDLIVYLEPGDMVKLRCVSTPSKKHWRLLGARELISNSNLYKFDQRVKEGSNRFVASSTEITVAHAVNKPLLIPVITRVALAGKERMAGDTFVKVICDVRIDPRSTGKVSIEAW